MTRPARRQLGLEVTRKLVAEGLSGDWPESHRVDKARRLLCMSVPPDQVAESMDRHYRARERDKEIRALLEKPGRVARHLARARIDPARYQILKEGDAARAGERRPLAFATWEIYDELKASFAGLVEQLEKSRAATMVAQFVGSAARFYSNHPDPPFRFFDRSAHRWLGPPRRSDVNIDLISPELSAELITSGAPAVNDDTLERGLRVFFNERGVDGTIGVYDRVPELASFVERWSSALGREIDLKLRLDLNLPRGATSRAVLVEPMTKPASPFSDDA